MNEELASQLQSKVDGKTKPPGSLRDLEQLALRVGLIHETLEPQLKSPTMLVLLEITELPPRESAPILRR